MAFGTFFTLDAVAEALQPVNDVGEDTIWDELAAYFAAHNELFSMVLEQLAETTTDRQRGFGGTADMVAQEMDEFGTVDAQKIGPEPYNVGFPLRRYGFAIQWTRFAFEDMTATEFANQVNAITDADEALLYRELRRALFRSTGYTFTDRQQTPQLSLAVKPLVNADSMPLPTGPIGTSFDGSTHTHYLGVTTGGSPTQAEVIALKDHVTEHYVSGTAYIYINKAQEATVRGFTDFNEYLDARLVDQTAGVRLDDSAADLDRFNHYDRAIGLLDGAEVWVKPWIPAGYMYAFLAGQPMPLVQRVPLNGPSGLRLMAENERFPLRANEWNHRFGVAVWNRTNGAVLDTATGGGTYTAPTIN